MKNKIIDREVIEMHERIKVLEHNISIMKIQIEYAQTRLKELNHESKMYEN
jgi:hypothetical protein